MADGSAASDWLVWEAIAALEGEGRLDAQAVQQVLASAARSLAKALPVRDGLYDPALDGPPMSPEEIKAAAIDARNFLWMIADLFGTDADPDWTGEYFAFAGAMKKRSGWKPPKKVTPAARKRQASAVRVYELMAEQYFETGQPPQQEAAIAAAMQEFSLARSKVMQGLKEYREAKADLLGWMPETPDEIGKGRPAPAPKQRMATARRLIERVISAKVWFQKNPTAHFLYIPAGSALEKEMLSRESPRDRQDWGDS